MKKIAIYKDKLAVQLHDRIIIYDISIDETTNGGSTRSGSWVVSTSISLSVSDPLCASLCFSSSVHDISIDETTNAGFLTSLSLAPQLLVSLCRSDLLCAGVK